MFAIVCLLVVYILFDVNYIVRLIFVVISSIIQRRIVKKNVLDPCVMDGIVLTTDLDAMFHMNNARYLRECDLAQTKLWLESHVVETIGQRFQVTNAASNIRFRRSLEFLTRYQIISRFLHWDEKAFYIEQQFVRLSDGFVCAVNICKQATIGCTPSSMIKRVDEHLISPPMTEELRALFATWKLSSERLRKSS
ncbi:protein THEM6-like [Mizuhopecten yessoensis]|uniref:Protein THEM6 n=1 Tax=Mizuhopecten yessoensis TaxID=6573 RepID=A0A210Q9A2_MIZYE|nr:protein THEM6-like [Mizuhopecten yessoensis]OWF45311.1 Protein THEM6 [Mizuhopecten yessoensis]